MRRSPSGILPLIAVERDSRTPLYRQVYRAYREAIVEGRLRPGQRVPSSRALASELGISRIPIFSAFEQLLAEGYLEARVGSGTYVSRSLPAPAPPPAGRSAPPARPGPRPRPISRSPFVRNPPAPEPWNASNGAFRLSQPALEELPYDVWARLIRRHTRNPKRTLLGYSDARGRPGFREVLASYLRISRGVQCEADQLLVVSGSQQALQLCARVLLDPGSPVWVEEPGYAGARAAFEMEGPRLVPVPVDEEGLDVDAGIARCPRARAVYVTPSHQYPLGVTMSARRRLQLLDWARRAGAWIVEDDYDSEYRYESLPVSAIQGLDRDARVIYIGTFSKVLFPSLRVGYLVLPPDLVDPFTHVRGTLDIFPSTLYQAALEDFLAEGHFARHLRHMRAVYRERRGALVEALRAEFGASLDVLGAHAGMHLVMTLSPGLRDRAVAIEAARQGMSLMPLSACYLGRAQRRGFVLGYGSMPAREAGAAVTRLGKLVRYR
jgi:GntR family transcriptional regulator / MocR family aminotransferase